MGRDQIMRGQLQRLVLFSLAFLFVSIFVSMMPTASRAAETNLAIYQDQNGMLYSVPLTGGKETLLTSKDLKVHDYWVAATGNVVIWAVDNFLYSVPVTGGTPVKISKTTLAANDPEWY